MGSNPTPSTSFFLFFPTGILLHFSHLLLPILQTYSVGWSNYSHYLSSNQIKTSQTCCSYSINWPTMTMPYKVWWVAYRKDSYLICAVITRIVLHFFFCCPFPFGCCASSGPPKNRKRRFMSVWIVFIWPYPAPEQRNKVVKYAPSLPNCRAFFRWKSSVIGCLYIKSSYFTLKVQYGDFTQLFLRQSGLQRLPWTLNSVQRKGSDHGVAETHKVSRFKISESNSPPNGEDP